MDKIFRFRPILKQTLWGGSKIAEMKHLTGLPANIGESWEVSGVEDNVSVVEGGEFNGTPLTILSDMLRGRLVGEANYKRFGRDFPLLIKFIDAHQDLSIQVHPSDEQAHRRGKLCGKTEMWVIMDGSSPWATLRVGFCRAITPSQYRQMVADGTICDVIARYNVREGDCFFLPPGRIHSIGPGSLLLEIQQTSDITYRIFDFNRLDKDGKPRQLHTEEAAECIDYSVEPDYRMHYNAEKNIPARLVSCPHFTCDFLDMDGTQRLDIAGIDSFLTVTAIKGAGTIQADDGPAHHIQAGETLLVAATANSLLLTGNMNIVTACLIPNT